MSYLRCAPIAALGAVIVCGWSLSAPSAQAASVAVSDSQSAHTRLTYVNLRDNLSPGGSVQWDSSPGGLVPIFLKENGAFLNPADEGIDYLLSTGQYTFDFRLNKGVLREMTEVAFVLGFDDSITFGIDLLGSRDFSGGTPPFTGDLTHTTDKLLITLTDFRVSSFDAVDEVGEFLALPDGNIDYVGQFSLLVSPLEPPVVIPLPAMAWPVLITLGAVGVLTKLRRSREATSESTPA